MASALAEPTPPPTAGRAGIWGLLGRAGAVTETDLRRRIEALSGGRRLLLPFAVAAGTCVLVLQGIVLLAANWRLLLLELVPAVWLATVLWDLRYHTIEGHSLAVVHGWAAIGATVVVVAATAVSYWCNVTFAIAALDAPPDVRRAARRSRRHLPLVLGVAVAIGALHAWVAVRGTVAGLGWFAIGLSVVVAADMYLYTALPARVIGLERPRRSVHDRVARSVIAGTIAVVAATPGFLLSRLGQLLLATSALRLVGLAVLAVAVLLQVAGVSSTRAVSVTSDLLASTGSSGRRREVTS